MNWQPTADLQTLRQRATLLAQIRQFFQARHILEVETPLLCAGTVTDPALAPFSVSVEPTLETQRFLQTSPEYPMKRLLAEHGEPIFQICKAFRQGEAGSRHNPEFTLVEWYRPGVDHHQLMDEVEALLRECLGELTGTRYSYRALFQQRLSIDPFTAPTAELESLARSRVDIGGLTGDKDLWLDLLMSHVIEPTLENTPLCFIYDYPASQAALSRIVEVDGQRVGQRFEVYLNGIELANGYCELTDPVEQRRRFEADNELRARRGLAALPVDERLLAALEYGLPPCSGVALGIDRLVMAAGRHTDLGSVMAFDWARA